MMHSPFLRPAPGVRGVMLTVLLALLPGIAVYAWQFGAGILVNLLLASCTAVAAEAAMLRLRGRAVGLAVGDLSALVTAWLVALSLPPLVPWWLTVLAVLIAIVAAKHLYGGLGQNPFNPAMAAYCAMIVAYPALMSQWPAPGQLDFGAQLDLILGGPRNIDAISSATVLDALRTGLRAPGATVDALRTGLRAPGATVDALRQTSPFGAVGGSGWEWVGAAYLLGGFLLLARRVTTWHMPLAFLLTLALVSGVAWLIHPAQFAPPWFHLASGGTLLAAFFIITDPVSGATTPRGKLIFGAGIALVAWLIRSFGAYPEGIAFAVLLMNICVPLIDMKTQPPVFGHRGGESP